MKRSCFLHTAIVCAGICGTARADDGPIIPRGALESGANVGQFLSNAGTPGIASNAPFSRGLGQIVSGWTQQGIRGDELAERVHWLQRLRADEMAERTRSLERQRDFDRDDRRR